MKKTILNFIALLPAVFLFVSCSSSSNSDNSNVQDKDTQALAAVAPQEKVANFPRQECSSGNCVLLPGCSSSALCDASCYESTRQCHHLSEKEFRTLVEAYHKPMYDPRIYAIGDIMAHVNEAGNECNGWKLKVADYSSSLNNDNIELDMEDFRGDTVEARYSIALIKAVIELSPTEVHFYKAKHANGCDDIVFKAYNGTTQVYCGDLSGLFP
jgi:hypothetical protein